MSTRNPISGYPSIPGFDEADVTQQEFKKPPTKDVIGQFFAEMVYKEESMDIALGHMAYAGKSLEEKTDMLKTTVSFWEERAGREMTPKERVILRRWFEQHPMFEEARRGNGVYDYQSDPERNPMTRKPSIPGFDEADIKEWHALDHPVVLNFVMELVRPDKAKEIVRDEMEEWALAEYRKDGLLKKKNVLESLANAFSVIRKVTPMEGFMVRAALDGDVHIVETGGMDAICIGPDKRQVGVMMQIGLN